jgi:hypothetical protein
MFANISLLTLLIVDLMVANISLLTLLIVDLMFANMILLTLRRKQTQFANIQIQYKYLLNRITLIKLNDVSKRLSYQKK